MSKACVEKKTKKYQNRPSPPFPANECKRRVMKGNNGKTYKSVADKNGVYRWKLKVSSKKKKAVSAKKKKKAVSAKKKKVVSKKNKKKKASTRRKKTSKHTAQELANAIRWLLEHRNFGLNLGADHDTYISEAVQSNDLAYLREDLQEVADMAGFSTRAAALKAYKDAMNKERRKASSLEKRNLAKAKRAIDAICKKWTKTNAKRVAKAFADLRL